MGPQHGKPQCWPVPRMSTKFAAVQQIVDGYEISETLRHLLAFDLQEAVVHPVVRHYRRMEGTARLRNFVLVVRENKVDAAAMDVKSLAEMFRRHGGTFGMPA